MSHVSVRSTTLYRERELIEFASKAAKHFAANKNHWSFGNIGCGEYLALRWGMGDDCVLVIKQHEDAGAVNFGQAVKENEA